MKLDYRTFPTREAAMAFRAGVQLVNDSSLTIEATIDRGEATDFTAAKRFVVLFEDTDGIEDDDHVDPLDADTEFSFRMPESDVTRSVGFRTDWIRVLGTRWAAAIALFMHVRRELALTDWTEYGLILDGDGIVAIDWSTLFTALRVDPNPQRQKPIPESAAKAAPTVGVAEIPPRPVGAVAAALAWASNQGDMVGEPTIELVFTDGPIITGLVHAVGPDWICLTQSFEYVSWRHMTWYSTTRVRAARIIMR